MGGVKKFLLQGLNVISAGILMWRLTATARVSAFFGNPSARASPSLCSASSSLAGTTHFCGINGHFVQKYAITKSQNHRHSTLHASATTGDNESSTADVTTSKREWNLGALQKEVVRQTVRCHKKIGKARQRLDKANQEVERLTSDANASLEELEACPNVDELEADLQNLQSRLKDLNKLEVLLTEIKTKGKVVTLPDHVSELAIRLEADDEPQQRSEKVSKKEKGPRNMQSFRLPYRRFYTKNKTEIRVGKQAEDNDELSTSPEHRDSADWWMHASGCPGSHVIIRCHDQNLDEEVVQDAAALAARQSKCSGNTIKVSMTRARDVKKPPGAKAGLVQLTGQVRTVSVNMKEAQERLDRLDATVLVN